MVYDRAIKESVAMYNKELEAAVYAQIKQSPAKRIIIFDYEGASYVIKRRLSNGRNRFAKENPSTAFWCEAYKIMTVNSRIAVAPHIALLGTDFFVMKHAGRTLQVVAKASAYEAIRRDVFYEAGRSLSLLHQAGLHHGRPALRDIAYDSQSHGITLLDWENEKAFVKAPAAVLDLFLFLHSCFREEWRDTSLQDAAVAGYLSVPTSQAVWKGLLQFIHDHSFIFSACHHLSRFGWIDVSSVDWTRTYIEAYQDE